MEYLEIRAVIKYLKIKGLSEKETHAELVSSLADNAPCFAMVKAWYAELSRGTTSTEDALQTWVVETGESLGNMKNTSFQSSILVIFSLSLGLVSTEEVYRVILQQEVTSNGTIKTLGNIPELEGDYVVNMFMFVGKMPLHGKVMLCKYRDDRQVANYIATRLLVSKSLQSFKIVKNIRLNPGEHLKIIYKGVDTFSITKRPSSYIILVN